MPVPAPTVPALSTGHATLPEEPSQGTTQDSSHWFHQQGVVS